MSADKRNILLDSDFELLLHKSVPDTPPEDVVDSVTPWKKAIDRVLTGFALSAVTFNFAMLNYILPAIGMVMVILGFRALRRENRHFGACYIIAVIRACYFFPLLVLNTTIYHGVVYGSDWITVLTVVNLLLQFVQYYCLWRGLREVREKANLDPSSGAGVWLMVWHVVTCLLGLVGNVGWIIFIGMIAAYVCIIRSLFKLSKELDEAGYAIFAAPVRYSDRALALIIALLLLVGAVCGYVFGSSYKMDWTVSQNTVNSNIEDIKSHLLELGFPEYVLSDLTEQDILACKDAVQVISDVTDHPVNDGRTVTTKTPGEEGSGIDYYINIDTVYDTKELKITGVAVRLPAERESWLIIHHFLWTENPGFFGTECIQLWPAYRDSGGWSDGGVLSGRLLYDKGGVTYTSPYHSLGSETYESDSIFWGKQTNTDIFAAFSLPNGGTNHRGYISYSVSEGQDMKIAEGYITDCWINYLHHNKCLQYPSYTAIESRKTGIWSEGKKFKLVQDALQFYVYDSGGYLIN